MSRSQGLKEKLVTVLKDNLKIDEKEFVNPWSNQDKASVLQQSRCFADTPIDFYKCLNLLTRMLYLIQQGEEFTPQELTTLFFGVTKLFQATNSRLRRMVYLIIKELEPSETEVFICMACLIKDMNSKNDCFRANSLRVLSRFLDPAMAAQIERYLKTAIVDKNPFVASSALVCGIQLTGSAPEVVRRWGNEIQETVTSKHRMVQFHALALLYELKKSDRMALHKVVTSMASSKSRSVMAECLLIRYATQALTTDMNTGIEKTLMAYLDSCLRNRQCELTSYEAARAFCSLAVIDTEGHGGSTVFGYDMSHTTTVLQIFLASPKPVMRFGAIKTLNMLAQHRPHMAAKCNSDMEPLLSDTNRNTATLALTTLLKTGNESSVERLVKQITTFMSDISDAFKIDVVRGMKGLALQYPGKYKTLMAFLSSNLREDGTAAFKKDLVDAIITIIERIPAAREMGLLQLCDFIEDCEYASLCTRILEFMGEEVPKTSTPAKYIRYIYNRLILEIAVVRAAAVDALARIAMKCPALQRDVLVLLQFGQNDNDDEVRDRITLYSSVLQQCVDEDSDNAKLGLKVLVSTEFPFSIDAMYDGLLNHIGSQLKNQPFVFADLPSDEAYKATQKAQEALAGEKKKPSSIPGMPAPKDIETRKEELKQASNSDLLRVVGEICQGTDLGPLQHTCKPASLTESEAEYTVQCIKHMFKHHVVLEMYVSNTIQGVTLEQIEVRLSGLDPGWAELGASAISALAYDQQASAYLVLQKQGGDEVAGAVAASLGATLHFIQKEDGDDLGAEDEYPVENVTISTGDYMFPRPLAAGQFKSFWEQLTAQGTEATRQIQLNYKSLEPAVQHVIDALRMEPCDKTGKVEQEGKHTMLLSGAFLGGQMVLAKALLGLAPNHGVAVMKIQVRAKSQMVCDIVTQSLG